MDREHDDLKRKIAEVNKHIPRSYTLIWVLLVLLIISMTITGIEVLRALHPVEVTEYKLQSADGNIVLGSGENWDYVLQKIGTDKKEYNAEDNLTIELSLRLNNTAKGTIEYEIVDEKNKTIYRYSDEGTIHRQESKEIILTKNYKPGKYYARATILVEKDRRYLLTGLASFRIAKGGIQLPKTETNTLLLLVLLLLNSIILLKQIRNDEI